MSKLEEYEAFANAAWADNLKRSSAFGSHLFLDQMDQQIAHDKGHEARYPSVINPSAKPIKWDIDAYVEKKHCKSTPTKVLPKARVEKLNEIIQYGRGIVKWSEVKHQLDHMANYLIYPTTTLEEYSAYPDHPNILILGAGPIGLMVANLIFQMFYPRSNILLVDNRVAPDGVNRLPYTRDRVFGVRMSDFGKIIPRFAAIDGIEENLRIKYFEYLLLTPLLAGNFPICFTRKLSDANALKAFVEEKRFDIVYDCTGGRLPNDFLPKDPPSFFDSTLAMSNEHFDIVKKGNSMVLERKDGMKNRFYLAVNVYVYGELDAEADYRDQIMYVQDLNIIKPLHNVCLYVKPDKMLEFLQIFDNLKDTALSKWIQYHVTKNRAWDVLFYIIEANPRHLIRVAAPFKAGKQKCLYVALGDTAYASLYRNGNALFILSEYIRALIAHLQIFYSVNTT